MSVLNSVQMIFLLVDVTVDDKEVNLEILQGLYQLISLFCHRFVSPSELETAGVRSFHESSSNLRSELSSSQIYGAGCGHCGENADNDGNPPAGQPLFSPHVDQKMLQQNAPLNNQLLNKNFRLNPWFQAFFEPLVPSRPFGGNALSLPKTFEKINHPRSTGPVQFIQ